MCTIESISYLVSSFLYLALAVVFLSAKGAYSKEYVCLKRLFALCALIAMLVNSVQWTMVAYCDDCGLCDRFLVPVAYICQAYLLTGSILYLMQSPKVSFGSMAALSVPFLLLVIFYVGCFGEFCSVHGFSFSSYFSYAEMDLPKTLSVALNVLMFLEVSVCAHWLFTESQRYALRERMADSGVADTRSLAMLVFLFCVYFALALISLLIPGSQNAILFEWLSLITFSLVGFAIFHLRAGFAVRGHRVEFSS